MHAAIAVPGSASTILTHVFGRGLADERYVVERFQAMADGDIRRAPGDAAPAKGRRKAKRTVVTLKAVRQLRPTRTEIIVCTGPSNPATRDAATVTAPSAMPAAQAARR